MYHNDRRELKAIIAGVPMEMGAPLEDITSTKEGWDSIATARIDIDRVHRITQQRLHKELENLVVRPNEQIDDFALRLTTLKQQMARHGDKDLNARSMRWKSFFTRHQRSTPS